MRSQRLLSQQQIEAFYTDRLTHDQVEHFLTITDGLLTRSKKVVDVGGGCGFFAFAINAKTGLSVRVLDMDATSVAACRNRDVPGVEAEVGDALAPEFTGDEGVICFNLILHHLVGDSEKRTREMQTLALATWADKCQYVFVNEYVYEALMGDDFCGRAIYEITKNTFLSSIARIISKPNFMKTLRANTFGVGVRFRSDKSWRKVFVDAGFDVISMASGPHEAVPLARRLLMIKSKRRDSYLLKRRPIIRASVSQQS